MDAENIKNLTDSELFKMVETGADSRQLAEQELHDRGYSSEEIKEEINK